MTHHEQVRDRSPLPAGLVFGALVAPGVLGVSACTVALPALTGSGTVTAVESSWLVAGYALTQAIFVAVFGRLADRYGLRTVLLAGAVLLSAGSAAAVAGTAFAPLLAGRLLQGAGAGSLQLIAFATVGARYAGARRARVLGVIVAFVGVVSGAGTAIGGGLTAILGWRAAFALPALSLLAMAAIGHRVPRAGTGAGRLDPAGATLVAVVAVAVVLLSQARALWLSAPQVIGLVVAAAGAGVWSVARAGRVPDGFLPAGVLASRRFVPAALAAIGLGAAYLCMLYTAPILLGGRGWGAGLAGVVLLPAGALGAVSARLAGSRVAAREPFRVVAACAAVGAAGLTLPTLLGPAPAWTVLGLGLAVSGFTAGQVRLLDTGPALVPARWRSTATGLLVLMFLLGGAVGAGAAAGLAGVTGLYAAAAWLAVLPASAIVLALVAARASAVARS